MSENPLKQYFRRPAIYIGLPSGLKSYSNDVVEQSETGEFPVYPMTAIDEITARTPDALFNGTAVVDIIKSCIPAIKNPWKINSIDFDSLLIAIRIASSGDNMDIDCVCPKCQSESKFGVNMVSLLASRKNVDYQTTLKVRDLEIKFKPLTYAETNSNSMKQYEIQKTLLAIGELNTDEEKQKENTILMSRLTKFTAEVIASTIEWIKTPELTVSDTQYILEFIINCDRQTSNEIRSYSIQLTETNKIPPLDIKCISCQFDYQQPLVLNVTDFFA